MTSFTTSFRRGRREFLKNFLFAGFFIYKPFYTNPMLNPTGVIVREISGSVAVIAEDLIKILKSKGVKIYVVIDQQKELSSAGIIIPPMQYVLFGNPKAGGAIIASSPVAALDLPLKILIWEENQKNVKVAYNDYKYFEDRYNLNADLSKKLDLKLIVDTAIANCNNK